MKIPTTRSLPGLGDHAKPALVLRPTLVAGLMLALAACGSSSSSTTATAGGTSAATPAVAPAAASSTAASSAAAGKKLRLAYLPFTVANSYEAPMLAAAQAAARSGNASLTVLSADNDPAQQFSKLQDALSSGQYDGIVVQPIQATGLTSLVTQAIAKGLKVVTMDQILGPDNTTAAPQVTGLSASVVFVPTVIGTKLGKLVVQACATKKLNPCNVGYLYDLKASSLDVAIHDSFTKAISGTPAKIVGEGEDFYTPSKGLSATQTLLQAHPEINLIVASDQGIEGGVQAVASAGKAGKVLLVGYGASKAGLAGVSSGAWFGEVAQTPATEGTDAVNALVAALRTGASAGGSDPSAALPNAGVITKANVSQFSAQWPG